MTFRVYWQSNTKNRYILSADRNDVWCVAQAEAKKEIERLTELLREAAIDYDQHSHLSYCKLCDTHSIRRLVEHGFFVNYVVHRNDCVLRESA